MNSGLHSSLRSSSILLTRCFQHVRCFQPEQSLGSRGAAFPAPALTEEDAGVPPAAGQAWLRAVVLLLGALLAPRLSSQAEGRLLSPQPLVCSRIICIGWQIQSAPPALRVSMCSSCEPVPGLEGGASEASDASQTLALLPSDAAMAAADQRNSCACV